MLFTLFNLPPLTLASIHSAVVAILRRRARSTLDRNRKTKEVFRKSDKSDKRQSMFHTAEKVDDVMVLKVGELRYFRYWAVDSTDSEFDLGEGYGKVKMFLAVEVDGDSKTLDTCTAPCLLPQVFTNRVSSLEDLDRELPVDPYNPQKVIIYFTLVLLLRPALTCSPRRFAGRLERHYGGAADEDQARGAEPWEPGSR